METIIDDRVEEKRKYLIFKIFFSQSKHIITSNKKNLKNAIDLTNLIKLL